MVAVDRLPGVSFIEDMMIDECEIERDIDDIVDMVLNETTGELEQPQPQFEVIFHGNAVVATMLTHDREISQGRVPVDVNTYRLLLPVLPTSEKVFWGSSGDVRVGDIVHVIVANNDPALKGKRFRISKVDTTTHKVYRKCYMEDLSVAYGSMRKQ